MLRQTAATREVFLDRVSLCNNRGILIIFQLIDFFGL